MQLSFPAERALFTSDIALAGSENRSAASGRGGEAAEHRMGARHHQRRTRALVGHVAEQQHEQIVTDRKVIDQIAADLLGRLQDDFDRQLLTGECAIERRRCQRELKRARLVQFRLLAPEFFSRAVAQRLLFQRRQHARPQQRRIERLEEIIFGAEFDASHHGFDFAHRRDHDDRQVVAAAVLAQRREHPEPVQLGHHDVEKDEIVVVGRDGLQRLDTVGRLVDLLDIQAIEAADEKVPIVGNVVDDQDLALDGVIATQRRRCRPR